ncbi:MAG: TIGR03986 family CRISPR-associated RAMP protein [Mailhella sp.]|nr:TIGR03986 family CRISPR-associated RAMP protein [Mailhella sp.]
MSAPEIKGTLHIQEGKKGRNFQADFTNLKGNAVKMAVMASAIYFDKEKAAEGDEIILTLTASGQIEKCTIPGKEAAPVSPAGKVAPRSQGNGFGRNGDRNFSRPSGGQTQGGRYGNQSYRSGQAYGQARSASQGPALCDAVAPYNFIPYAPENVLAEKDGERGTWSGVLHCRLQALTPLLVAGERIKRSDESSECRFFKVDGRNAIPGSGIKGVLRSMVEILSFSAMRQVSRKELFWRIVAGGAYREAFSEEILGGYLKRSGADYELFPVQVAKVKNGTGPISGGERVKTGGIRYKDKYGQYNFSTDYKFSRPMGVSLPVSRDVFADFERQMTENQKGRWKKDRLTQSIGHPVFYRKDSEGKVAEIGLSRYFRRKYDKSPADLAASAVALDFAEKLFGKVGKEGTVKGRVAVEPAFVEGKEYRSGGCRAILSTPHPTSLAHYIVQNPSRIRTISRGTKNDAESLAGYSNGEKLRGWKMYWHHDVDERLWFPEGLDPDAVSKKVISWLYPLAPGASAEVKIHVDRLTDLELGAILEALSYASGNHAFKLGMGKPLGFGSVKLDLVRAEVEDVRKRYASLSQRLNGGLAELDEATQKELREAFRNSRLEALHAMNKWKDVQDYAQLPSVKALRAMTDFVNRPAPSRVRYMSLNEFKNKALLAGPEDVLKQK